MLRQLRWAVRRVRTAGCAHQLPYVLPPGSTAPPPLLPPPVNSCHAESDNMFVDAHGYRCGGWEGYNCYINYGGRYAAAQLLAVRTNCPVCCSLAAQPLPAPPPPPPDICAIENQNGFIDWHGYSCGEWEGYNCYVNYGGRYDLAKLQAIRTNCPVCCGLAAQSPPPPPVPPSTCPVENQKEFADSNGYRCGAWEGYNCHINYGGRYTGADLLAIRTNCPACCGLVVQQLSPLRLPPTTPPTTPPNPAPPSSTSRCSAEGSNSFVDALGYNCGDWWGFSCYINYGGNYDDAKLLAVRTNCPVCCRIDAIFVP